MKGLHIIADLYGCRNRDMLASSASLRDTCVAACKDVGLTVLGDHFYQFEGLDATQAGGATGAVVFAESHLAIHTWPERDGATLDVYVCNVTCDNSGKAEKLYGAIDASGFYRNPVAKDCRSWMNVPFTLADPALDEPFLKGAKAAGLVTLKGHRSVGGMRASIYNAMPESGVDALVAFMRDFQQRNG